MTRNNKVCSYCIMDTTVPDIFFDDKNQCQYCKNHIERIKNEGKISSDYLNNTVNKIKEKSNKNAYDCIIGVSGGVDSTFVAYYLKRVLNLNPLAVHLDNGWNSELAVENIRKCLDELDIDLVTHVINWKEFKSVQKALIKSSIIFFSSFKSLSEISTSIISPSPFSLTFTKSPPELPKTSIF